MDSCRLKTVWFLLLVFTCKVYGVTGAGRVMPVYVSQEYEQSLLDPELCTEQMRVLPFAAVTLRLLDASARIPSGILSGNLNDLGNYHDCLAIKEEVLNYEIQGKYCTILLPVDQTPSLIYPTLPPWPTFPALTTTTASTWPTSETEITTETTTETVTESTTETPTETTSETATEASFDTGIATPAEMEARILRALQLRRELATMSGAGDNPQLRIPPVLTLASAGLTLAFCIPKVCPTRQAVEFVQRNLIFVNFTFHDYYCRLPADKPWAPADIVAITIFSFIGLLVLLSTMYDLNHTFVMKRNPKDASSLLSCFSIYTNTRRLLTFNESPETLECVDGIRSISMMWVVVGHTFVLTNLAYIQNLIEATEWITKFENLWVTAAPITVDTFFLLSGILAVYTTIGKITKRRFVLSLHLYYLNRYLRMFPLLATVVLLQASLYNHVADGPFWENVALATERCRSYWWSALLHVQNYVNPTELCIAQTWYISVDMQLIWISPLVLIWMFGVRRWAWLALGVATTLSLISSSVYSFLFNFPAAIVNMGRLGDFNDYMTKYYVNTLTRAPPFFVGMIYGYLLHLYRGKKLKMPLVHIMLLWFMTFTLMAFAIFTTYPVMQTDHDKQTFDNFLNAYVRALWAVALGWLIFACHKGYGGPINWLLSLQMWKLPARLSYGMYLVHFQLMLIVNGTWTQTKYFSTADGIYRFFSDLMLTFCVAFLLGVLIDAPFSTIQKIVVNGGGKKKRPPPKEEPEILPPVTYHQPYLKTDSSNGAVVVVPEASAL